jgi:hypothetical protein
MMFLWNHIIRRFADLHLNFRHPHCMQGFILNMYKYNKNITFRTTKTKAKYWEKAKFLVYIKYGILRCLQFSLCAHHNFPQFFIFYFLVCEDFMFTKKNDIFYRVYNFMNNLLVEKLEIN